ncbi:MAG TPA: hypothetical protein VKQ72_19920, partial [Aggregatilineales bacterium]|nr:hypothetical protein [Aggregatilineales bacterium]
IANAWKAMGNATDCPTALAAIDSALQFDANFHLFALRNLNWDFDGNKPIPTLYDDTPMDVKFPARDISTIHDPGVMPTLAVDAALTPQTVADPPVAYPVSGDTILSLRAHYYEFQVAPEVRQVTFDFSKLQPRDSLDIDAVAKISGKWKLLPPVTTTKLKFCRDTPDQDVSDIYLVLSNHNKDASRLITGETDVSSLKESCTGTWSGTLTVVTKGNGSVTKSGSSAPGDTYTDSGNISDAITVTVFNDTVNETRQTSQNLSSLFHDLGICPGDTTDVSMWKASGGGVPDDDLQVQLNLDGSYTIWVPFIGATGTYMRSVTDTRGGGKPTDLCYHPASVTFSGAWTGSDSLSLNGGYRPVTGKLDRNNPNNLTGTMSIPAITGDFSWNETQSPLTTTISWNLTKTK